MLTKEDAIKQKEEAEKVLKLYEIIGSMKEQLEGFKNGTNFTISEKDSWLIIPVEASIAKQIGYKYYNELTDDYKKQLKELGFTWEEEKKPEPRGEFFGKAIPELMKAEDLNKQYAPIYGEWPKKETTDVGEEK